MFWYGSSISHLNLFGNEIKLIEALAITSYTTLDFFKLKLYKKKLNKKTVKSIFYSKILVYIPFLLIFVCCHQLKERDAKLEEAGDLHRFLRSVDHFQAWLTKTQTDVASEGNWMKYSAYKLLKALYTHVPSFKR